MAAAAVGRHHHTSVPPAQAPKLIVPEKLTPFVDPFPIPSVARPPFRLAMTEFALRIHRDVPPTRFWGFNNSVPGPTIEVESGQTAQIEWINELPTRHFLPIDHNLMGAEPGKPEVRTAIHVHGAKVPPQSDGYPENWFVPGQSMHATLPNQQAAAQLWYHDHAMGITRLNMVAGLFGQYIVRDDAERGLNLPSGPYEIPLVLFDRMIREDGQLYYPVSQDPKAPWIPEFFGECVLINGKLLPYLVVEPRKYRFRILNAANARFFSLRFDSPVKLIQIGSDQGLLPEPVAMDEMMLAPGERADVIVDFSTVAGKKLVLLDTPVSIMQFRVRQSDALDNSTLPMRLREIARTPESEAIRTRRLTLDEYDNLLDEPMTHLLNGKRWHDPVTEDPLLESTEIWELFNLTDDVHPVHLHLVRFQVLDRRPLDVPEYIYNKRVRYTGDAVSPERNEMGWKDTVRATPRAVTRIIVKFEGYAGRYVWHCHIAEHEDNEMMRPFDVRSA